MRHCGEIGRHEGLKIPFWRQSAGSSPAGGMKNPLQRKLRGIFYCCIAYKVWFGAGRNADAAQRFSIALNRSRKL